jgi:hypothetical protein
VPPSRVRVLPTLRKKRAGRGIPVRGSKSGYRARRVNEDEQSQKWPPWAFASLVFVIAVLVLVIAAVLVALFVSEIHHYRSWG